MVRAYKISLLTALFIVLGINTTQAIETTYTNPLYLGNPIWYVTWSPATRIQVAEEYCITFWETYVSHINDWIQWPTGLYAIRNFNNTSWDTNTWKIDWYISVTCDDWVVDPWGSNWTWTTTTSSGTGTTVINNYITVDWWDWINKEVFTQEVIDEIYLIEGTIMIVLVVLRFMYRLTWRWRRRSIVGLRV